MDYQKLASDIIKQIGGKENVEQLEHCSTRLRFTLADNAKANRKEIEQLVYFAIGLWFLRNLSER